MRGNYIYMKLDEIRSLKKLLDYSREDEERHYDECEVHEKRNHIVHAIRRLDKLIVRMEKKLGSP